MDVERMKTLVASMDGKGPAEALYAVAELQRKSAAPKRSLVFIVVHRARDMTGPA